MYRSLDIKIASLSTVFCQFISNISLHLCISVLLMNWSVSKVEASDLIPTHPSFLAMALTTELSVALVERCHNIDNLDTDSHLYFSFVLRFSRHILFWQQRNWFLSCMELELKVFICLQKKRKVSYFDCLWLRLECLLLKLDRLHCHMWMASHYVKKIRLI